ncbi:MAG: porin family protein [Alphaproteobacteria bacterium]|nr:porin family protein [Alphaproteobacteria bacterium]
MRINTRNFIGIAMGMALCAHGAYAAPARPGVTNVVYGNVQSADGRYVEYQSPKEAFSGSFYIGAMFGLNFANFSLEHYLESNPSNSFKDSYSFALMPGFDLSAGYQFSEKWRAELNYGYTGKFQDEDNVAKFSLSSQYVVANVLYNIWERDTTAIYVGAGAGAAMLDSRMSGSIFPANGNVTKTKTTYAAQIIIGVEESLTSSISAVLQYRLMYTGGMKSDRVAEGATVGVYDDTLVTDISGVFMNSILLGARVKF